MRRTNKRSFTVLLTAALLISTIPAPPQIAYADNTITNEMSIKENAEESDNTTQSESEVEEAAKDADTDKSQTDDSQTDEALADKPVNDAASPIEQTKAPEKTTPPSNSQKQEATALAVPENVSWGEDQETMCWDAVDNADGYEIEVQITDTDSEKTKEVIKVPGAAPSVDITDIDTTEADTFYDYSSFMEEGYSYKFRVKAVTSDKKLYTDSEYSSYSKTNDDLSSEEETLPGELLEATALAVPKDISWGKDHGTMCWAAVDHADSYEIEVQITDADSKESLDVIEITNTDIADEDNADTLDMIDLYTLDITDLDTADRADADTSYDYSSSMKEGCSYKFRVKAVTSDQALYEDSEYSSFSSKVEGTSSQEPQGEALATPEDISWGKDLGMMSWAAVDHADSYEVDVLITDIDLKESQDVFKVTKEEIADTDSEDEGTTDAEIIYDYSSSMKTGYSYKFRVKAVTSDEGLYTDSEYSSFSKEAPSLLKARVADPDYVVATNPCWKKTTDGTCTTVATWDEPDAETKAKIKGIYVVVYRNGVEVPPSAHQTYYQKESKQFGKFNDSGTYTFKAIFRLASSFPNTAPSIALAESSDEFVYTAPETHTPTPTGLIWDPKTGRPEWDIVDTTALLGWTGGKIQYSIALYDGAATEDTAPLKTWFTTDIFGKDVYGWLKNDRVYKTKVAAGGDAVNYTTSKFSDFSSVFKKGSAIPDKLMWNTDGSIQWNGVDGPLVSDWNGEYTITLYGTNSTEPIKKWTTAGTSFNQHTKEMKPNQSYKFKIALNADGKNSSGFSDSHVMGALDIINGKLDELILNGSSGLGDAIRDMSNTPEEIQSLKVSLQNNGAAASKLKELETLYVNSGVTACEPETTDGIVEKNQVTVVGGTLNGASELRFATATVSDATLAKYEDKVGMDIELADAQGVEVTSLKFPVSITMPAPSGMMSENVRIIHYKGNNSQETITPRVKGNTIEFVVSSFSTFVFYDITSAKRESSGGGGSRGGGGGGGGGGNVPKGINNMLPTPPSSAPVITGVWEKNDTGWYLKKADGSYPVNQWASINGAIYRFSAGGRMIEGWISLDNKWYYLKPDSGTMALGWVLVQDKWYHLNPDGTMATGWVSLGNKWYYMGSDGAMLTNTKTPDGYTVNKDGVRID